MRFSHNGCFRCTSRGGIALTWMEKNAAYIDWKFRRIKKAYPGVRCVPWLRSPRPAWKG